MQIRTFLLFIWLFTFCSCGQNPENNSSLFTKAKAQIDNGDFESAIVLFDTLIARNPRNDSAIYHRGIAYAKLGDKVNALNDFSLLVKVSQTFQTKALKERGILYYTTSEFEKALQDFDKAIKIDPNDFYAYYLRAVLKTERKIFDKNPEQTLSAFYTEQGKEFYRDHDGAFEDYNKAIELNPKFAQAYYGRGLLKNELESNFPPTSGCTDICLAFELGYPKTSINNCKCK